MVDVGACYGEMAAPFLHAGWTADLFEPDPACREVMGSALAGFGERAQLHALAVSDEAHDSVPFYKAKTNGLSGLGPSPYGDTEGIIRVPAVRLGEHLRTLETSRVDFLKVDAEGQDLKVLASHDFAALPPRFVFIELNSEFPGQNLEHIRESLAAMRARGYQALLLRYEDEGTFKQGIWDRYWLKDAQVVQDLSADQVPLIANVIFYREDDTDFVRRFVGTLDRALAAAA
jgi:FkbM family methyltransferase